MKREKSRKGDEVGEEKFLIVLIDKKQRKREK